MFKFLKLKDQRFQTIGDVANVCRYVAHEGIIMPLDLFRNLSNSPIVWIVLYSNNTLDLINPRLKVAIIINMPDNEIIIKHCIKTSFKKIKEIANKHTYPYEIYLLLGSSVRSLGSRDFKKILNQINEVQL